MTTRTPCTASWAVLLVAALACADRPTEVRRVPVAQFAAVKFWDVTASTRWNKRATTFLSEFPPPDNGQARTSRMLTYLSIAQYRAVLAAEAGKVGSMHPSESAAAAGASAAVLRDFFPSDVATIEGWLADDRTNEQLQWPGEKNEDVAAGEAIGRAVAAAVIAQKNSDNYLGLGSDPGTPPVGPGYWVSAPTPIVRSLHGVRPFFLTSPDQLRPAPPPAFGSPEFNIALQEIRTISDERPLHPEYATIALFYAWQTAPFTAGNLNLIADDLIVEHHSNEREAARILAYANAAAFDAQIACFDAKFAYWFIRPTQADPLITRPAGLSLPNHPSYPSGHSCISSAILTTLADAFPSERERLESLISLVGLSRMYGGLHYRFDVETGEAIGRGAVALARAGSLE